MEECKVKKKSLKKAAVLAIAGAMAVTSLAACGGSGSGKDSEGGSSDSLTMAWWGNQVRNERTQQALDAYKEESGITVSGQFYQWGDYWSKMATSAAGKKMPDVIQMDMSYIQQYVDKGQLLDLTPYIEDGTLDTSNISEDIVNMGKVGDGIYGIAAGTSASCMFYNKTLLDELGITINDNMTLDEFIDISKQVYEETGYRSNLYHYGLYMDMYARANDIQASDKLGGDSADDYLPYFETLETGIKEGWQISPSQAADTDSALTTIPTTDPQKYNYVKPAMYFSVSADTANPEEAVKLLNYLTNSETAYDILLAERGVPASTAISEAIMDKLSPAEQENANFVNNVIAPNSSPMPPFPVEGSTEAQDLLRKLEEKVKYGEYTAQQAADEYFTEANKMLQGE